jgi:predicted HicB family RNase H-like nuclease
MKRNIEIEDSLQSGKRGSQVKRYTIRVSDDLARSLEAAAKAARRTINAEATLAFEHHVKQPNPPAREGR